MKRLHLLKIVCLLIITVLPVTSCTSFFTRAKTHKVERQMAGSKRGSGKMREAPGVRRAKAAQEKKQEKNDREFDKFVKNSREHNYDIQSDDVKTRMKNNQEKIKERDKAKAKKTRKVTKRAGRKYGN